MTVYIHIYIFVREMQRYFFTVQCVYLYVPNYYSFVMKYSSMVLICVVMKFQFLFSFMRTPNCTYYKRDDRIDRCSRLVTSKRCAQCVKVIDSRVRVINLISLLYEKYDA